MVIGEGLEDQEGGAVPSKGGNAERAGVDVNGWVLMS